MNDSRRISALQLAEMFHTAYEAHAPECGYTTREDTRVFDPRSPNGKTVQAACATVLLTLRLAGYNV